jgi:hypothetical protein
MFRTARILLAVGCAATVLSTWGCTAAQPAPTARPAFVVDDAAVNQARYDCLVDQGFAVTKGESGAVVFVDPKDEQFSSYQKAWRQCEQQLADRGLLPPAHVEDLRHTYQVMTKAHDCLVAKGFPLTGWPSEESYVDSGGQANLLEASRPVDPAAARDACPAEFEAMEAAS